MVTFAHLFPLFAAYIQSARCILNAILTLLDPGYTTATQFPWSLFTSIIFCVITRSYLFIVPLPISPHLLARMLHHLRGSFTRIFIVIVAENGFHPRARIGILLISIPLPPTSIIVARTLQLFAIIISFPVALHFTLVGLSFAPVLFTLCPVVVPLAFREIAFRGWDQYFLIQLPALLRAEQGDSEGGQRRKSFHAFHSFRPSDVSGIHEIPFPEFRRSVPTIIVGPARPSVHVSVSRPRASVIRRIPRVVISTPSPRIGTVSSAAVVAAVASTRIIPIYICIFIKRTFSREIRNNV